MTIEVVGLSGKLGTGKDYIAREYFFPLEYKQISLAWHFKNWIVGQGLATWDEVFKEKPSHVRRMLQLAGTEEGREIYGQDIWVDTLFAWVKTFSYYWDHHKYIIPDVRFPNEVEGIRRNGGKVYRIVAPNRNRMAVATEEQRNHPSEISLDDYPLERFDGVIMNDPEHKDNLSNQMKELLTPSTRESFVNLYWDGLI